MVCELPTSHVRGQLCVWLLPSTVKLKPDGEVVTLMLATKVLAPGVPSSTLTLLVVRLAVARSVLPSALKSPTATAEGAPPMAYGVWPWNVPSPLPSRMLTDWETELATNRSALPSPFMSPTATETG